MVVDIARVKYKGFDVGAVSYNPATGRGAFEYEPGFIDSGQELSPIKMPLSHRVYTFPEADPASFHGLPGLIADSLPDDFGNSVLNAWVAGQGKSPASITPLERLKYIGTRGMGALTYHPAVRKKNFSTAHPVAIPSLIAMAQDVVNQRAQLQVPLDTDGHEDKEAMMALLSVGISAGGARPKAVLAFNADFSQARSGQSTIPAGFSHFIMKFDGVSEHNRHKETFGDPLGYGTMEYVYYLMATACGIAMMPCHLLDEGQRRHFITRRFDREGNKKLHMQTLSGLAHVSYKQPGSYSYAELLATARQLRLRADEALQIVKRMVFNIVARNHDDHSKNFAFLFDDQHGWKLAPAYDLAYSYKPGSPWVNSHWMTLNNKRDDFTREDIYSLENLSPLFSRKSLDTIIDETREHVSMWPPLAKEHGVPTPLINLISGNLRLEL